MLITKQPAGSVEHLLRELAPQVLAALMRRFSDFPNAEDAVQEALLAAATQWPRQGVPEKPRGWLIQVASRKMTDQFRADLARRRREELATPPEADTAWVQPALDSDDFEQDDTLRLLFMCCHPALTRPAAIALTLRAVGGLTTAEIANAFLVPEVTMAQRITRAKQRIQESGVRFHMPRRDERAQRLGVVMHVLYLIFSEGYASSVGAKLQRADLASEAIRLTRFAQQLAPENSELTGLLALMLLTDARRSARSGPHGELIALDEQDRNLWDRQLIDEGTQLITSALSRGSVGSYQLQAAIAAVHDEASSAQDTDWPQILALYELLLCMSDNPMVVLSHAIAAAMVHGVEYGLELLKSLDADERFREHYRLHAVRAHLLERSGALGAALDHYERAAAATSSIPERDYLLGRAERLARALNESTGES